MTEILNFIEQNFASRVFVLEADISRIKLYLKKKIPIDNRQRPVNDIKNNSHSFISIIFYHSLITIKNLKIHTYLLHRCQIMFLFSYTCFHIVWSRSTQTMRWDKEKQKRMAFHYSRYNLRFFVLRIINFRIWFLSAWFCTFFFIVRQHTIDWNIIVTTKQSYFFVDLVISKASDVFVGISII